MSRPGRAGRRHDVTPQPSGDVFEPRHVLAPGLGHRSSLRCAGAYSTTGHDCGREAGTHPPPEPVEGAMSSKVLAIACATLVAAAIWGAGAQAGRGAAADGSERRASRGGARGADAGALGHHPPDPIKAWLGQDRRYRMRGRCRGRESDTPPAPDAPPLRLPRRGRGCPPRDRAVCRTLGWPPARGCATHKPPLCVLGRPCARGLAVRHGYAGPGPAWCALGCRCARGLAPPRGSRLCGPPGGAPRVPTPCEMSPPDRSGGPQRMGARGP